MTFLFSSLFQTLKPHRQPSENALENLASYHNLIIPSLNFQICKLDPISVWLVVDIQISYKSIEYVMDYKTYTNLIPLI